MGVLFLLAKLANDALVGFPVPSSRSLSSLGTLSTI